jgi:DNA-binding NarL/FixJ family response regulator
MLIKLKILIVDDMPSMRMLVMQYLRRRSDVVVTGEASNADDAISKARALSPDIILMDISLAGVSGVEVTKQIKTFLPDVRVYLFSAYEVDEFRDLVLNSPADGFIQKSNIKAELMTMIEKEISAREQK